MKTILTIFALTFAFASFSQQQASNPESINYYDQTSLNNDNPQILNFSQQPINPPAQAHQGRGLEENLFVSNENKPEPCTDCDKVKKAIKASHYSASGNSRKPFSYKRWVRTTGGKMHMQMKKMFARSHKVKTSYSLCFNWQ
ncbi:MAG: hypothetical protein EPN85_02640 [Bacteroidetes bacterium]|nr:MAG: hypothetical protein EPN85_02640 [Bacteroidota bacterium]